MIEPMISHFIGVIELWPFSCSTTRWELQWEWKRPKITTFSQQLLNFLPNLRRPSMKYTDGVSRHTLSPYTVYYH